MFKWIFRHTTHKVAITLLAPDRDAAWAELETLWNKAAEMGIDLPHWQQFEPVEQIVV